MTGARVRPAGPDDGPALQALAAAVDGESEFLVRDPGERPAWAASRRPGGDVAAFLATGNSALFLAEADGAPVGYLAATGGRLARTRGVATIALGVRARWRGRGIGTTLLDAVAAWAQRQGLHRLELTVATGNQGAARLYRRLGYAEEGRLQGSLRIGGADRDEWLMARLFPPADAPAREPPAADACTASPPGAGTPDVATIRPARPGDAAAWLVCDRAVRAETHFLLRAPEEGLRDLAHARRFLAGQAASARAFSLLAEADGAVVALASAWSGGLARTAHETALTLAVRRDRWGRGIGGRLLDAVEERARMLGQRRLSLWVLGHNARAIALYARHGFVAEATARRFARIDGGFADHVLMAKRL